MDFTSATSPLSPYIHFGSSPGPPPHSSAPVRGFPAACKLHAHIWTEDVTAYPLLPAPAPTSKSLSSHRGAMESDVATSGGSASAGFKDFKQQFCLHHHHRDDRLAPPRSQLHDPKSAGVQSLQRQPRTSRSADLEPKTVAGGAFMFYECVGEVHLVSDPSFKGLHEIIPCE